VLTCMACDSSCLECNESLATSCTSCLAGKFLTNTNTCGQCDSNCLTCETTAENCTSCSRILDINTCVPECPDSKFVKESFGVQVCDYCDSTCLTCTSTPYTCTSCSDTKFLSEDSCLPCDPECGNCVSTSTTCTSCPIPTEHLYDSQCYTKCPALTYIT
jgi:hypothetical protein